MERAILIVEDELIVAKDLRRVLREAGNTVSGIARSVEKALSLIHHKRPGLVLLDIYLKGDLTGIDLAGHLKNLHIPFIYLSANSNESILQAARTTEPYGFLVKPFRPKDLLIALDIAWYRYEHGLEDASIREQSLQRKLHSLPGLSLSWGDRIQKLAHALQPHLPFDYMTVGKKLPGSTSFTGFCFSRIGFDEYRMAGFNDFMPALGVRIAPIQQKLVCFSQPLRPDLLTIDPLTHTLVEEHAMRSHIIMPWSDLDGSIGFYSFYSRRPDAYLEAHQVLLGRLMFSLVNAATYTGEPGVGTAIQSTERKIDFAGIIGNSPSLLSLLDEVRLVAPLETSVLIMGESGTGKEGIADAIHRLSPRRSKPLIKLNCAALPLSLVESELFGHEKGAFTGAIDKRIGKFELADGGTIFLDEVGELSPDVQVKLLRVLQQREVERVGGGAVIKIDVRIIAATNRDLDKEVAAGRFRLDLYYRLNIFPIVLPPLRHRGEDILLLADSFARRLYTKYNRTYNGISKEMTASLKAWHWPGNIRELENLVEKSVILQSDPGPLQLNHAGKEEQKNQDTRNIYVENPSLEGLKKAKTDSEREYILFVLRKSNGRIRGEGGAARILDINPTTLESRISKLGITRDEYVLSASGPPGTS